MHIITNRANLVVCITSGIKHVRQQPNGATVISEPADASAIYATDNDTFYPLAPGSWNADSYRAVEVEKVPEEVVPGYWYYSGEFFTTPEKTGEHEAALAKEAAVNVSSIAFVTLAEGGQIDDITITENASLFQTWDEHFTGKAGTIVRDEGKLYKNIHNIGAGQNTKPSSTPSQWTQVGDPGEEWPEWIQPIGKHDAYKLGAKVTHNGIRYTCTGVNEDGNNTWEPGVYGWTKFEEE